MTEMEASKRKWQKALTKARLLSVAPLIPFLAIGVTLYFLGFLDAKDQTIEMYSNYFSFIMNELNNLFIIPIIAALLYYFIFVFKNKKRRLQKKVLYYDQTEYSCFNCDINNDFCALSKEPIQLNTINPLIVPLLIEHRNNRIADFLKTKIKKCLIASLVLSAIPIITALAVFLSEIFLHTTFLLIFHFIFILFLVFLTNALIDHISNRLKLRKTLNKHTSELLSDKTKCNGIFYRQEEILYWVNKYWLTDIPCANIEKSVGIGLEADGFNTLLLISAKNKELNYCILMSALIPGYSFLTDKEINAYPKEDTILAIERKKLSKDDTFATVKIEFSNSGLIVRSKTREMASAKLSENITAMHKIAIDLNADKI
jgi:hypothetical protein